MTHPHSTNLTFVLNYPVYPANVLSTFPLARRVLPTRSIPRLTRPRHWQTWKADSQTIAFHWSRGRTFSVETGAPKYILGVTCCVLSPSSKKNDSLSSSRYTASPSCPLRRFSACVIPKFAFVTSESSRAFGRDRRTSPWEVESVFHSISQSFY